MNPQELKATFRHLIRDPFVDWISILSISFVTAVVLVALGISVYLDTQSRLDAEAGAVSPAHAAFDPALLTSILGDADMRASIRSDRAAHYSIAPDPSLP